ncbi:MAG: hypothetical protein JXX29_00585 [Deltaproteobacteria bacterium]|nr:hypothetical protein [Deltaproteobacteria bacterium]MBN2670133.1 hypothetical protein [Deltaproteobacteria bacterium]
MASKKKRKKAAAKVPFYKNINNIITFIVTVAVVVFMFTYRFEADNLTGAERLYHLLYKGVQTVTVGCEKPPNSEIEAYYQDSAGSIPVAQDFDADEGELCGNGRKYFCTSLPPDKPIPLGWEKPPRVGDDPNYEGPSPFAPFKESPHAMPSSKAILSRAHIADRADKDLVRYIEASLALTPEVSIAVVGKLSSQLSQFESQMKPVDAEWFNVDDDEIVAKKLEAMGFNYVLFDRTTLNPPHPWMEETMGQVGMRMRDAVSLHWFYPVVLGSRYALYRRVTPFEIPKHVKRRLTKRVRAMLSGEAPEDYHFDMPLDATGDDEHRVVVSLRKRSEPLVKGRKLDKKMSHDKTLLGALDSAVKRIQETWPETVESVKKSYSAMLDIDLKKEIDNLEIEIDVLYHQCYLSDRTPSDLVWYVELGLEGVMLNERAGARTINYLEPSYAVQMETTSELQFLERMLKKANLNQFLRDANSKKIRKKRGKILYESAFYKDNDYDFKRFRSVNWVERPKKMGRDVVEIYRGVPLKTIWDVSYASLIKSLELGAGWLINNQTPDGQFRYKYEPLNKPGRRWEPGGNIVRHALNPYTLLMVNKLQQKKEYVESAKKGINFSLKFLRKDGNRCLICHRDPPARYYNAKLNAVAVTVLSILKLSDVADISEYEDALSCMAEEMLYMQDKNGHYRQYDVPPDHPYYGAESTIHAGEFIFVLARLYSHYKDKRFKEACDKSIDYYMQQWNKSVKERTRNGIYDEEHRVNLIGIVPWLVTAMEDLHRESGDKKYAELGLMAQDWIDQEFFWWQHRAQYPDYVGASFKVHRELPAVNSCQYAEGASAAYAIAKRVGRDVEERRQVVVHSMRYCLQVQHESYDSTFFVPNPVDAMGGFKYTLGHLRVRNDYNYHAMAAIAQAAEYLEPDDYPAVRPLRILPVLNELLGDRENPAKDMTMEELRAAREAEAAARAEADKIAAEAQAAAAATAEQM